MLTKLDGSAKGGIALAIQSTLGIPVKLVGLGETAEDLIDFDPDAFIDALFAPDPGGLIDVPTAVFPDPACPQDPSLLHSHHRLRTRCCSASASGIDC